MAHIDDIIGILKILPGKLKNIGDQIPVDLVVNTVICAAALYCKPWSPLIVHSGSSSRNPIIWHSTMKIFVSAWHKFPLKKTISKPSLTITSNKMRIASHHLFKRTIPLTLLQKTAKITGSPAIKEKATLFKKVIDKEQAIGSSLQHFV